MATNLAIDDNLLEEARIIGKHATKKAVVNEALAEYVQRRKQAEIINLFHKVDYDSDYDYKAQRQKK
jgi:Arc/MetJ family transcription regulator